MKQLHISILGKPLIEQNGKPLPGLVSRKSRALLCYLAYTGQPHSRQALSGLFWSEMTEEKARRNLRVALTRMKDDLEDYLIIQRRTLAFNKERPYWLDVSEFESILRQKELSIDDLKQATDLYRGPFLDDFDLRDAPLFEEWVRLQQEHYRQMAMDGLYRLSARQTEARQFSEGIDTLNRLLKLEPWMEEAHRQLMLLLAVSGQRSAALSQYETCADLLSEELGVDPSAETIALYQKIRAEELDDLLPHLTVIPSPAPRPLPPPFQVPAVVPHFVGRTQQKQAIVSALKAEEVTAVQAIVGMGGVGKSALAAQIAAQLQGHFHDGVLWANAANSEPMSVLESWARLYGYDFSRVSDVDSMAAAFRGALADKRVLLVLDDVTSAARIRPLLPSGPHCRVLLTMRDQDLARSLNAQVWPLRELSPENGRLLLTKILGEERVQAEQEAAAAICDELQNLPLAVEITAQRLKSRPRRKLADMAQRLQDEKERLSLLTISDREVRASFAISWETLDARLQQVFALLGLFGGGSFTGEVVAYLAELDPYLAEDLLYALVALSLLSEDGQTRYRQHPLLADFAREQLGEDVGEVYGRFASYYLSFAQQNQHDYDALRPEWDNLMVAMEAAHTHQLWQTVIDFADALHDAWFTRGRFTQARQGYQWTYKASSSLSNQRQLADICLKWSLACIEQNQYEKAIELLKDSYERYQNLDNLAGLANVHASMARIAMNQARYDEAEALFLASKSLREQVGDQAGIAEIIKGQARISYRRSNYQAAYEFGLEALLNYQSTKNKLGELQTLGILVNSLLELSRQGQKKLDLARIYSDRALQLAEALQDQGELAVAKYGLSRLHTQSGEFATAEAEAKASISLLEKIGDRRTQASVLMHLSENFFYQEQYQAALETAYATNMIIHQLGAKNLEAVNWWNIGHFHTCLNESDQAKSAWSNSFHIAKEIHDEVLIARLIELL